MKKIYKRIANLISMFLCMVLIFTILPAIPASAATSLRGESIYQIMVDRFYDGDPTNNATGEAFRYTENTQDNAETGMLDFPLFQAIVNDFAYGQNFNNTSELSIQAVFDQDWMYGII